MPCPVRRNGTRNLYFYKRIPVEVCSLLDALRPAMWPKAWGKEFARLSLGTADEQEAKIKCSMVSIHYLNDVKRLKANKRENITTN
jgi:hypothetical protein